MLMLVASAWAGILVDAPEAERLVAGGAVVLDARGGFAYFVDGHIPGAVMASWRGPTFGSLTTGNLGEPARAAAWYAELGVRSDKPVLVVGSWEAGWGEEGRVWWDLSYLGHPDVHVLRGGMAAWAGELSRNRESAGPGSFTARPRASLRASREDIHQGGVLVDVREVEEYEGARKFLEARGGHIPGSYNRPWRSLLRGGAPVAPEPSTPVIVYCTGGVRSAFVTMLLRDQGYTDVRNYDGGWWEWARAVPASE